MGIERVRETVTRTVADIGRAGLNALMPDDFEYYALALELHDSQGGLEAVLNFPVMPVNYSETKTALTNIKKTGSAVVVLKSSSFSPVTISIQGTFGRKLRILTQQNSNTETTGFSTDSWAKNDPNFKNPISGFDFSVKSGYGLTKMLEKIYLLSSQLDDYGQPKILFLYNPAIGNNYVVEILNLVLNQSKENNIMWNYSLELKATAPAKYVEFHNSSDNRKKKLQNILGVSIANKTFQKILPNLSLQQKKDSVEKAIRSF